jgi:hypothetical protein
MYGIHYVTSRESDQAIDIETSVATDLAATAAGARQKIKNSNIAIPPDATRPRDRIYNLRCVWA